MDLTPQNKKFDMIWLAAVVVLTVTWRTGEALGRDCGAVSEAGDVGAVRSWAGSVLVGGEAAATALDGVLAEAAAWVEAEDACGEAEAECDWCWELVNPDHITGLHYRREHRCRKPLQGQFQRHLKEVCGQRRGMCVGNLETGPPCRKVEMPWNLSGRLTVKLGELELCCWAQDCAWWLPQDWVAWWRGEDWARAGPLLGLALASPLLLAAACLCQCWAGKRLWEVPDGLELAMQALEVGARPWLESRLRRWTRLPRQRAAGETVGPEGGFAKSERDVVNGFERKAKELTRFPDWLKEDVQAFDFFCWPNGVRRSKIGRKVNLKMVLNFRRIAELGLGDLYFADDDDDDYATIKLEELAGVPFIDDGTQLTLLPSAGDTAALLTNALPGPGPSVDSTPDSASLALPPSHHPSLESSS